MSRQKIAAIQVSLGILAAWAIVTSGARPVATLRLRLHELLVGEVLQHGPAPERERTMFIAEVFESCEILTEEGFGRLLRHPAEQVSTAAATPGRDTRLPRTARLDFASWPERCDSAKTGLLLLIPDLVALDLPTLVARAGYPGTRTVPAVSWLASLLALKLTRTRRVSHVDDLLLSDPAAALLACCGEVLSGAGIARPSDNKFATGRTSGRRTCPRATRATQEWNLPRPPSRPRRCTGRPQPPHSARR